MVFSRLQSVAAHIAAGLGAWLGGPAGPGRTEAAAPDAIVPAAEIAAPYSFTAADLNLLDAVQQGCFHYLWREAGAGSGLAKDRRTTLASSLGGVGFQLSALPIGVEQNWITRAQGEQRAISILQTLSRRRDNRRQGVYLHFVHVDTGGPLRTYQNEASTVDHALLTAGALVAAGYFGGETASLASKLAAETNWRAYAAGEPGFISLAWKPTDNADLKGAGRLMPETWRVASDEERLLYFLAVGCPTTEFAVDPQVYYKLQRTIKSHASAPPYVVSFNGALFTYFFSHCWINYRDLSADDPSRYGVDAPRVDWFENSRRAVLTHRQRCLEQQSRFATFAPERWGLSPCMGLNEQGLEGYLVPEVEPNLAGAEAWHAGTVAPYAAGAAIMFTPVESLAALHAMRALQAPDGSPLVWRDPAAGGYGFADSFNLDQQYATDDNVAIDVGPLLLAIENVRTGLVWRLFMQHDVAQRAVARLGLTPRAKGVAPR